MMVHKKELVQQLRFLITARLPKMESHMLMNQHHLLLQCLLTKSSFAKNNSFHFQKILILRLLLELQIQVNLTLFQPTVTMLMKSNLPCKVDKMLFEYSWQKQIARWQLLKKEVDLLLPNLNHRKMVMLNLFSQPNSELVHLMFFFLNSLSNQELLMELLPKPVLISICQ